MRLYRFAISLVQCNEAAEEIVHDVLVSLWKRRNTFDEITNLNTYLYVSIKNLSLNYLRDQDKLKRMDIETLYDKSTYISIDPESLLIKKEQIERLNTLINNLPLRCKMVFKLIKVDGLKYKEAAALLNISTKTVENQLAIAFKKIAEILKCI
ncbi:MAG: RNA polymerase sigma-70 factor [Pedobacter sp.]|nr:RNA polymerase sigma-70 factor [Pedobacter sp.]